MDVDVPVAHVHKTHIYYAPRRLCIFGRYSVNISPVSAIRIHNELDLEVGPEIRLELFELYVNAARGLSGRPRWKCHFELIFF